MRRQVASTRDVCRKKSDSDTKRRQILGTRRGKRIFRFPLLRRAIARNGFSKRQRPTKSKLTISAWTDWKQSHRNYGEELIAMW